MRTKRRVSKTVRLRRIRNKLFEENPFCHWCGKAVIKLEGEWGRNIQPNLATLDHLYSRLHPLRTAPRPNDPAFVLACYKCNHKRGEEECRSLPLEEQWVRSSIPIYKWPILLAILIQRFTKEEKDD